MRSVSCWILMSASLAWAADQAPLTAERAAQMAVAVAPEVAAARIGQAIAAAEVRAGYAFIYPHLSATASYTRSSLDYQELPTFGRVAFNQEDDWRGGAALDQFLYAYDRLGAARDADSGLIQLANQDLKLSQRDTAHAARVAFESVRLGRARVKIAQERVAQREGERDDAKAQVDVGRARTTDGQLAEIALAQATDELAAAQAAQDAARIRLAALIGMAPAALPIIAEEPLARPALQTLLTTATARIEEHGEAARFTYARQYEEATSRIMDSEDRPMLGLRATYGGDGSDYDELEDTWTASVSLTWNIYDGGGTIARTERLAQRSRQLAHQREAVVRDRRIALEQARSEATSLATRITQAQRVVELANLTYEDSRAQYREGRLTLVQVGDSSVRLAEARYRLLSLLYQEAVLGHDLEKLAE